MRKISFIAVKGIRRVEFYCGNVTPRSDDAREATESKQAQRFPCQEGSCPGVETAELAKLASSRALTKLHLVMLEDR